jgi:8-oxo-dGTP pyrophosphatase MutT (NUDIX family)
VGHHRGHVENGETCWAALCRELHEELGITEVAGEYFATLQTGEEDHLVRLHVYHVFSWQGLPEVRNDEHSEVGWFDKDGIDCITDLVSDEYRTIIARLLR